MGDSIAVGHTIIFLQTLGCALAEPSGSWRLTFAFGPLENLSFFTQIICWVPCILQVP